MCHSQPSINNYFSGCQFRPCRQPPKRNAAEKKIPTLLQEEEDERPTQRRTAGGSEKIPDKRQGGEEAEACRGEGSQTLGTRTTRQKKKI